MIVENNSYKIWSSYYYEYVNLNGNKPSIFGGGVGGDIIQRISSTTS